MEEDVSGFEIIMDDFLLLLVQILQAAREQRQKRVSNQLVTARHSAALARPKNLHDNDARFLLAQLTSKMCQIKRDTSAPYRDMLFQMKIKIGAIAEIKNRTK